MGSGQKKPTKKQPSFTLKKSHFIAQPKFKSDKELPAIRPPNLNQQTQQLDNKNRHNQKKAAHQKSNVPSFRQQKHFLQQMRPANSRGPTSKSGDVVDSYSLDIVSMNIFENQVFPIGIYNIS